MPDPGLPARQADQRDQWKQAAAAHARKQRTGRAKRRAATATGIRIPAQRDKDNTK